ncbi:glucosaminidase domain-containing protein [Neobacillus sp. OS1-32]|uniref:Glucosaminidase domain-containing protein n=1 Tax=Neobacillus paridis TaxID=2803862 RepID=A0ABS1TNP2_9BACI|nr:MULTISPECIES: glucosaminidase domain-containing protein [Neobacillus]MBL4952945.1 glucosaminidase domain-containing protein [Neobacillus paridis]WML31533.1 glucosaminidase domain-containing protein [Neobacillus sp. OS1-32]
MKIGDDWYTKSLLIDTLYRNQNITTQTENPSSDFANLFMTVLNNLLMQSQAPSTIAAQIYPASPDTVDLGIPSVDQNTSNLLTDIPIQNDSFRFSNISAEKLNQELDGKLKGMGEVFIRAGNYYNVNPALLAAIAQHETGNGTSRAAMEKNNIAGMMGINGLKSYASVEESIMDMARNISKNYIGEGLTTIAKMGAKYAPVGAANDPTGLNNYWVTGVTKYFNKLTV